MTDKVYEGLVMSLSSQLGEKCISETDYVLAYHTRLNSKVLELYKKKQKIGFLLQTFYWSPSKQSLRTECNDLHDQEDYRMNFLGHPSVWR